MMKFTKSLRQTLLREVVGVQDNHVADAHPLLYTSFEEDGPPEVEIKTKVAGPWMWVESVADYKGATCDRTTDRSSGDPYSAHVFHDWVGEVKSAPKSVKHIEQLNDWALLHPEYERQYTDVGSWGVHSGRWVDGITKEGIVSMRVASKRTFRDVSPEDETTSEEVDLTPFVGATFKSLLGLIEHINPFVREIAAKKIGSLNDIRAVGSLVKATDDDSFYVQEIAIKALGNLGGEKATKKLATILLESEYPRASVSYALGKIGESALDFVLPALQSGNEGVSIAGVKIIEGIGGKKAVDILIEARNDNRPAVRECIVRALGDLQDSEVFDVLIDSLKDDESDIQNIAVRALGQLKDKRAVPHLVGMLLTNDKYVRENVAEALSLLRWKPSNPEETAWYLFAERSWDKLVAMGDVATETILRAMDDDDNYLRGEILIPISKANVSFTDPRIVDSIQKIYNDPEQAGYRHNEAIRALGGIGGKHVVKPLLQIYMDKEGDFMQKTAFKCITQLVRAEVDVADVLIPMLKKKPPSRYNANEIQIPLKLFTVVPASLEQIRRITSFLKSAAKRKIDKKNVEIASGMLKLAKLIPDLTDSKKATRESAAEALGKLKFPSAAAPLIMALEDDYPIVRMKATVALRNLGEGTLPSLLSALKNKVPQVRFGAAEALGGIEDVVAAKPLMKALKDKHQIVRQNAAWALGQLKLARKEYRALTKKVINALTQAMRNDEYLPVRFNAVYSLAVINESRVTEPLLEAMGSPDKEVRLNATYGFMKLAQVLRDPSDLQSRVIDRLIIALSDNADRVRYNAVDGLRSYKGEKALNALISVQDEKDKAMRDLVNEGIEEIKRMMNKRRSYRSYSTRVRYELRDPEIIEILIQTLGDDDEDIQRSAMIALGDFGGLAFDRLMEVLEDKEEYGLIREGAAAALGRTGDKRAVEALIKALNDEKREIRCNAAWALIELKDKRSLKALIDATNDDFWMVRLNASAALGTIKGRGAFEAVLRLLKDEHPRVREVSTSYLGQFKSPRVIPALEAQLNDEDEGVRKFAKHWIGQLEKKKSKSKKK